MNCLAHISLKEVLTNQQSFKVRELGHGAENTIAFVPNLVVLHAENSKFSFVLKHAKERVDRFVVDVIVVKVQLLKGFVVY